MASHGIIKVSTTTSPKGGKSTTDPHGGGAGSPKGQCLCSPTTHQGSFRCRFHRTAAGGSSAAWIMKRSNSMPADKSAAVASFSPKSVET
ncbi:hypothetical protein CICLE_v10010044mg [Citrus x clementina]|uniref:Serine-rich protein n=1 Tax=Citrus clementina TaxID=85681 RepID=V4WD35_CITCL|nr:hypothetical protein CICLE_v10010044mg [Citrus x clementina]